MRVFILRRLVCLQCLSEQEQRIDYLLTIPEQARTKETKRAHTKESFHCLPGKSLSAFVGSFILLGLLYCLFGKSG